jgi:MFS family permease
MTAQDRSPPTEESPLLEEPTDPVPAPVVEGVDEQDEISKAITRPRAIGLMASLALLIFLQATNFSLLTTTQSTIAADLDAFAETSWFTSAYLIAMSSVSPLAGRLSQVFSPRYCILVAAVFFATGSLVTSQAHRLAIFLLGRAITGVGAAGCLTLTVILVVSLASKKRRGLFFGLINTAVTTGVSLGAVLGGALLEPLGWVGCAKTQSSVDFC